MVIGAANWIGWATGVSILTRLAPDWPVMTPWSAALTTALAGGALLQSWPHATTRLIGRIIGFGAGLIAALMLYEYATSSLLGIDLWWFPDRVAALQSTYPGRSSPQTLISVLALSLAVGTLTLNTRPLRYLYTGAITISGGIAAVIFGAYLFDGVFLITFAPSTGMALTTAIAVLSVSASCALIRVDRPPLAPFLDIKNLQSILRFLLVLVGGPILIWTLRLLFTAWNIPDNSAWTLSILAATTLVAVGVFRLSRSEQASDQRRLEIAEQLAKTNAKYRLLAENSADMVFYLSNGEIVWVSPSVENTLGGTTAEWRGSSAENMVHPDDREVLLSFMERVATGEPATARGRFQNRNTHKYHWVEAHGKRVPTDTPDTFELVASVRIVDEAVHAQEELETLARVDSVTGLANRTEAIRFLDALLTENESPVGVLFCDVDHFKDVNDTHGHAVGDTVLTVVGERALARVRGDDLVARIGGDEFLIILPNTRTLATATLVANHIKDLIAQPISARNGQPVTLGVTVSVGVAITHPGEEADSVMSRADAAMYEAKKSGRNRVISID